MGNRKRSLPKSPFIASMYLFFKHFMKLLQANLFGSPAPILKPPKRIGASKTEVRKWWLKRGICYECNRKPIVMDRTCCQQCLMKAIIKESFKFDRYRSCSESTAIRGSCYVDQFAPEVRRLWIKKIIDKWNSRCYYTDLPIEIGSTASLDHVLPVSKVTTYGPDKVFHPDNLVWTMKGINYLKGNKTGFEFKEWIKADLMQALSVSRFLNEPSI